MEFGIFTQFDLRTDRSVHESITEWVDLAIEADQMGVDCCYALQDKVWVTGPGNEPWEVYVVKADADTLGKNDANTATGDACCGTAACCTPNESAVDPAQTVAEAKTAAGCACGD